MQRVELREPVKPAESAGFFPINKNFCNFPLARDGHVGVSWEPGSRTSRWIAALPGDERIWFRLPHGATRRPLPNGVDMCVLFALLRAAHMSDSNVATFKSRAQLLSQMGMNVREQLYNELKSSLDLWSALETTFTNWYDSNRRETQDGTKRLIKGAGKIKRTLPPPIRSVQNDGRQLRVVLDDEWLALGKHYVAKVPLPLPTRAPAQNLVLWLMSAVVSGRFEDVGRFEEFRARAVRRARLYRVIGVRHGDRKATLSNAIAAACAWFSEHGGVLEAIPVDDRIAFMLADPLKKSEPERTAPARTAPRRERAPAPARPREPVGPRPVRIDATDEYGRRCYVWTIDGRTMTDDEVEAHDRRERARTGGDMMM